MWLLECCVDGLLVFVVVQIINIVQATNIPSQVIELNDKFLQVKNDGLWFVDVRDLCNYYKTGWNKLKFNYFFLIVNYRKV